MSAPILCLPEEVMQNVFSYLSIHDKFSVTLVCKQWLEATNCPKLLERVSFTICNNIDVNPFTFTRRFSTFVIYKMNISAPLLEFLFKHGENIKKLSFKSCTIEEELVDSCSQLILCPNLRRLEFHNCYFDIFHDFATLKEFVIRSDDILVTDYNFLKWSDIMPKLEILLLKQPIRCTVDSIKETYSSEQLWHEAPSQTSLTLPAITCFLAARSKTLIGLEISNADFQYHAYPVLFKLDDLKLRNLVVHNNLNCLKCYDFVTKIFQIQPTLINLDLSCCSDLDDDIIKSVCTLLPSLQSLYVENNYGIDSSVEYIFHLKHLRYLSLAQSGNITSESFRKALNKFQSKELRTLDVHSIDLEDDVLRNVLKKVPQLRYLDIGNCHRVSNETIQTISENLVKLRYLELSLLSNVTDKGIYCPGNPQKCITNIKGLRCLYLDGTQITSHGFLNGVKFLELRTLGVPRDINVKEFRSKLKMQNPSLRRIFTY